MQKKEKETRKKLRYDANEGLLPEIRKHCGYAEHRKEDSTTSRGSTKKKKHVEEEWKWPEAQICAICATGGDILCCETCPASFHFSCIGFEASDFPDDNFFCNRCKQTPKGVQLFPPDKCPSTVCTQSRTEHENERNFEAIQYQYNRLKQEEADENWKNGIIGPQTQMETYINFFPDKCALKALGMANTMDFALPADFLVEREFDPNDSMEEKRPHIVGELCAECNLKDDWTSMLTCDYCDLVYHLKCVKPPLITIPRMSYWRCSRHTKSLIDSIFQGEEISREEKNRLHRKYDDVDVSFETFELFCKSTEKLRIDAKLREYPILKDIYYTPKADSKTSSISSVISLKTRKGGRGKKKTEFRFFDNVFSITIGKDQTASKPSKIRQKTPEVVPSERKDRNLDKLDQKRSVRFTDEELIMSVMPYDEKARDEHISMKRGGTEMEVSASFLNRHESMVSRSKILLGSFSEKEMVRLMKQNLDPVETVRASGVQCVSTPQDKTYKKKLKIDAELLVQLLGFGNDHADRQFNSFNTEAFFRRCIPPPSAQDTLNQGTLREAVLNSQKEAYEYSQVYKYHPIPDNLENFILLGYVIHFDSAKERDEYFVSSMTPWSKEPIAALTAKWVEENAKVKSEIDLLDKTNPGTSSVDPALVEDARMEPTLLPDSKLKDVNEQSPARLRSNSPTPVASEDKLKVEVENEYEMEKKAEEDENSLSSNPRQEDPIPATPENSSPTSQVYHPPDSPTTLVDKLSQLDFKGLKMKEEYEKAESVYQFEGFFGEHYDTYSPGRQRSMSENDVVDRPYWPAVHRHLQNLFLRTEHHETEHNYSKVFIPIPSTSVESFELPIQLASEVDEDERESSYSTEFAYPYSPPGDPKDNFAEPVQRKRGRPVGSKNRKEGEAPPKRKRSSVSSTTSSRGGRGRGGRPRGSRGRGAGLRSVGSSIDREGPSRRQSQTLSSDAPESPEPEDSPAAMKKLREEAVAARKKYLKMFVQKCFDDCKQEFFETRDKFLLHWTDEERRTHREAYLAERKRSLIPYEQRYFLTSQRVLAKLEINDQFLPIAIQRCLTKLGTAQDCHIRLNQYTNVFCSVLSDYHCDIVRDYFTDTFFLSTLATEVAIVNGIVVHRTQLTEMEAAERTRAKVRSTIGPSFLRCQCQIQSDQLITHQKNSGESIKSGIVKLVDEAKIQIGCATLIFKRV